MLDPIPKHSPLDSLIGRCRVPHRDCLRGASLILLIVGGTLGQADELNSVRRRPIAMQRISETSHLAIFNQASGTIMRLDAPSGRVLFETQVGKTLVDGVLWATDRFAAVDSEQQELLVGRVLEREFRVTQRIRLPAGAAVIEWDAAGHRVLISCRWAHQVVVLEPDDDGVLHHVRDINLPFAPRAMKTISGSQVLVADAFGGQLAMVDVMTGQVVRCRELKATHNITALHLARDGRTVHITHQMLNHEAPTTASNVHWGDVMSNVVRTLDLEWFGSDRLEETTADQIYYLGYPDRAAADPSGLMVSESGKFIIPLAGVNEVAISDRGLNHFSRPKVGRRPLSMCFDGTEATLYVANHLDDSISVVDVGRARTVRTISLGEAPPLTLAEEGEQFFYDASLSSDGWYSCHSCHTEGHSNGQLTDTFGDGYRGSAKRVLSLLGTAETGPWAWNGKMPMLEAQIRKSIETTMRGPTPTIHQVQALAAFLMSLDPVPGVDVARGEVDSAAVTRGEAIFRQLACVDCHRPPQYTSAELYDVGLVDAEGQTKFNPPSLRGFSHQHRLLHDNRATSLRDALQVHPQGTPIALSAEEWTDLETFLNSL